MRADSRGFTLLEVLVATTLLAVAAAFLAAALRMASAAVERGGARTEEAARLRAALAVVERSVRSADPLELPGLPPAAPYFRGEAHRLRFLSACAPRAASGGGLRLLCLSAGEGGGLYLSDASPFRAAGADGWDGGPPRRPLLPSARRVSFAYAAPPGPDGAWAWQDGWDGAGEGSLPAAVRLEVDSAGEDGAVRTSAVVVTLPAGG